MQTLHEVIKAFVAAEDKNLFVAKYAIEAQKEAGNEHDVVACEYHALAFEQLVSDSRQDYSVDFKILINDALLKLDIVEIEQHYKRLACL